MDQRTHLLRLYVNPKLRSISICMFKDHYRHRKFVMSNPLHADRG